MDYQALNSIIKTHPQWPGVTDEDLVAWCAEEVAVDKTTLPSTKVLETILTYTSEWSALTEANKATVRDILYIASGEGVPTEAGSPIRAVLVSILGTQTKAALAAAIADSAPRTTLAGLGSVHIGDIQNARLLG